MLRPIPKFVIILLVFSLIYSSSQVQAMDKAPFIDEREMGGSSTSQLKKAVDEAASRAASLRSEADKARLLAQQYTDTINETSNHCDSLTKTKLDEAKKLISDRLVKLTPDVKNIIDNADSTDFLAAAFTSSGALIGGAVTLNPIAIPILAVSIGYANYADNRDYTAMMSTMRQKETELKASAQAAVDRAVAGASIQAHAQSHWETAVREETARAQRAQEELARCARIEASRKVAGQMVTNNLFNTEYSEDCFETDNYKAYNLLLSHLDKTIHQFVCVFIYTLNQIYA